MSELETLREYEKTKKDQLKKAQAKFVKIGANYKKDDADKIKAYCQNKDISVSEFVKSSIAKNLNSTNNTNTTTPNDNKVIYEERIKTQQGSIKTLNDELQAYKDKTPYEQIIDGFKSLIGR